MISQLHRLSDLFYRLPIRAQCAVLSAMRQHPSRHFRKAFIHRTVQILGVSHVRVGEHTVIGQDCWLNVNHRCASQPAIVLGKYSFIGRRNFFSSGKLIDIGSYVITANDCHFLGSTHIVDNPALPIICAGTTSSDVISIGHNTFLGAGVRVLGNVEIGHGSVIGAGSLVTKDIPPFSKAFGSPAHVRHRYSFIHNMWIPTEKFTPEEDCLIPEPAEYLAILDSAPRPRIPHIAAGNDMGNL